MVAPEGLPVGHGSLMMTFGGKTIHVEPYEMVAEAAGWIRPKILYPYHFGDTDTSALVSLLEKHKDIEVRIRKLS